MIGKTISHYKILEKLGEGGMGKVYKAEDTKLKRTVALKFLPHHLVAGKSIKERFFHEARAASALNHPNIITIHDIHEEEGEVFLAMECVDGVLLSEKLKDGPLKQKELISIAIGIADGLNAAHDADITHRDIKSENIIISKDGQAKIIDFGLAKQKGMSQITQDGTTLGTQSYMSPEQVQGIKIDQRSDIFSFGVVLYQMATGKLPFEEEHEAAILYSIVNDTPIPVKTFNPNIDEELQRIISKALEKDVKDRYQHADDMLADLRKLKKGTAPKPTKAKTPIWRIPAYLLSVVLIVLLLNSTLFKKETVPILGLKSIAVLPFTTIDRTEDSEIFSAGIHDDILSQIAKIHDLKVVSRTSVVQYKDTEKSIKEIARELGVETILEGSVRRYGQKVRIVAQLINAKTDDHLWTDTYDRDYVDIFTIQSDVAQKIAGALNATLTPQELQAIEEIPTDNLDAYGYYQQGKIIFSKGFTIKNMESATALFEKAVELDPKFMLAYAELCLANLCIYWILEQLSDDHLQYAKLALNKAQKLDPNHSSVHLAQGFYYYFGFRDYEKALESWSAALKDRPNDSDLLMAIGLVKRRQGEFDEALELFLNASDIDPQYYHKAYNLGETASYMRKWKLAEQYFDRSILINPLNVDAYVAKIHNVINATGDIEKARVALKEALNHIPPNKLIETRAYVEFLSRNYLKALKIQQEYQQKGNINDMQDFWYKANYSLFAGKIELTTFYFDSLKILAEKAIQKNPKDWISQYYLALAYVRLGKTEDAIETANIATNLMPVSLDAISGSFQRYVLVEVYKTIGEFDKAIDELDYLLSIPSTFNVNFIKIFPLFDSLRDHPRFQEMLKKYGG